MNIAFPTCAATLAAFWEMLVRRPARRGVRRGDHRSPHRRRAAHRVGGVFAGLVIGLSPRADWLGLPVFIVLRRRRRPRSSPAYHVRLRDRLHRQGVRGGAARRSRDSAQLLPRHRRHPRALAAGDERRVPGEPLAQRIWKVVIPAGSGLIFAAAAQRTWRGLAGGARRAHHHPDRRRRPRSPSTGQPPGLFPEMFAAILFIILVASVSVTLLQNLDSGISDPELRPA